MEPSQLLAIRNLSSAEVVRFSTPFAQLHPAFRTKDEFIKWSQQPTTKYAFFNGYEGLTPGLRVSAANPAHTLHQLILDYDCGGPGGVDYKTQVETVARNCKTKPRYVSRTFSGGLRFYYFLTKPILVMASIWPKVMKSVIKQLGLDKLLPHLDVNYTDPSQYFSPGTDWFDFGAPDLDHNIFLTHALKAAESLDTKKQGLAIPLDKVFAKIQERFPNRWDGPFELNSRGCRFWDSTSDNNTGAIVKETGMVCWTGSKSFVSWTEIFGSNFVQEYEQNRIGAALEAAPFYFDGLKYWTYVDGGWSPLSRVDAILWLRATGLLSDADGGVSEVEAALLMIQRDRRIDEATPYFHQPQGRIEFLGKKVLNTTRIKLIEPTEQEVSGWGDGFPLLGEFLSNFFEQVPGEPEDNQLVHFLCWLKRFYVSCLAKAPKKGQVVYIAGDTGRGKTSIGTKILSALFGSHVSGAEVLSKSTDFQNFAFQHPIWTIDDASNSTSVEKHNVFSAMVKSMAANHTFLMQGKHKDSIQVPWNGRIIVTCNLDDESLRILPNMDQSLSEKLMIFKAASGTTVNFEKLFEALKFELPYFAKWLVEWDAEQEEAMRDSRYGVGAYIHPMILQQAQEVGPGAEFKNLLFTFLEVHFKDNKKEATWEGSATDLVGLMSCLETTASQMKEYKAVYVGRLLNQFIKPGHVERLRDNARGRVWRIYRDFLPKREFKEEGI